MFNSLQMETLKKDVDSLQVVDIINLGSDYYVIIVLFVFCMPATIWIIFAVGATQTSWWGSAKGRNTTSLLILMP